MAITDHIARKKPAELKLCC